MLKLVVVARDRGEERSLIEMAKAAVPPDVAFGVSVVPRTGAITFAERLDALLYDRPLAETMVVVDRDLVGRPIDLRALIVAIQENSQVAAVMLGVDLGPSMEEVVSYGGAFRCGPLCQAGGFVGDGRRSIHSRLEGVGFRTAVLPESFVIEVTSDEWRCVPV